MFDTFKTALVNFGFIQKFSLGQESEYTDLWERQTDGIMISVYCNPYKFNVVWTSRNADEIGDDEYNNAYYALGNIAMLIAQYI